VSVVESDFQQKQCNSYSSSSIVSKLGMKLFVSLVIAWAVSAHSVEQLPRLILSGSSTNGNRKFLEGTTKREYDSVLNLPCLNSL
jgi:hypothetical protein